MSTFAYHWPTTRYSKKASIASRVQYPYRYRPVSSQQWRQYYPLTRSMQRIQALQTTPRSKPRSKPPTVQRRTPVRQPTQRTPRSNVQYRPIQSHRQSNPQQGLPLGPVLTQNLNAGIVPGSSISGLQRQYRQMFTPRPNTMMSGQIQRQQHLAPGGLGHTGWAYRNQSRP